MTPPHGRPSDSSDEPTLSDADTAGLLDVLARARDLGFLGPGELEPHISHALGFAAALTVVPDRAADLGSGAGLPGLVLALCWRDLELVLIDATARRVEHLAEAIDELGLGARVAVIHERAEIAGRTPGVREGFDAVVARSFAAPAITAECAAPLLALGGELVTSEPPDDAARWDGLTLGAGLGLVVDDAVAWHGMHYHRCRKVGPTDERFPRRVGVPAKRPLF